MTECLSAITVKCKGHWMLHICSWFKHGCLLTSLTNQFVLDISQLARLMLMLLVKCSEKWLYLDVFIAVFLHLLPSWDLNPRWWLLTQIYSALLLSAPSSQSTWESHRPRWVPSLGFLTKWTLSAWMFFSVTYLLPLGLFSPLPLSFPSGPVLSLLTFFRCLLSFLIYPAASAAQHLYPTDRLFDWLTKWIFDWFTELWIGLHYYCYMASAADSKVTKKNTQEALF